MGRDGGALFSFKASATELPKMDWVGSTDAYFEMYVKESVNAESILLYKSHVIESQTPDWERCFIPLFRFEQKLRQIFILSYYI